MIWGVGFANLQVGGYGGVGFANLNLQVGRF
jgi:hypothetical protein